MKSRMLDLLLVVVLVVIGTWLAHSFYMELTSNTPNNALAENIVSGIGALAGLCLGTILTVTLRRMQRRV